MREDLRPIPDFPGYFVSKLGYVFSQRVRGSRTQSVGPLKLMKPKIGSKTGHLCVNLYRKPNKPERRFIHTLVITSWLGEKPQGMEVRHLNGDPTDNNLENLKYGTKVENYADSVAHGQASVGEKQYNAKLKNDQVREIKRLIAAGVQNRFIAAQFGIRKQIVARIKGGEIWRHVD